MAALMEDWPFRYITLQHRPYKVWHAAGINQPFWWAREWPLANASQPANRRAEQWQTKLSKAGLATSNVILESYAERQSFGEHCITTDGLLFLLSQHGFQSHASPERGDQAQEALLDLCSLLYGKEFVIDDVAACPVSAEGLVNIQVLHLVAQQPAARSLRNVIDLSQFWEGVEHVSLLEVMRVLKNQQQPEAFYKQLGEVISGAISQQWPALPRVVPTSARLDFDLQQAIADTVPAGPQTVVLADRMCRRLQLRAVQQPATCRLLLPEIQDYMASLEVAMTQQVLPRIAMALDASRQGKCKVLLAVLMDLGSLCCGYPVPQNMRDCRLASVNKEDVSSGMQCFMQGIQQSQEQSSGSQEQSVASGKQQQSINAGQHWAAFDLWIGVQNMLQQVGISLADFMLSPQSVNQFLCLQEPSWPKHSCI